MKGGGGAKKEAPAQAGLRPPQRRPRGARGRLAGLPRASALKGGRRLGSLPRGQAAPPPREMHGPPSLPAAAALNPAQTSRLSAAREAELAPTPRGPASLPVRRPPPSGPAPRPKLH